MSTTPYTIELYDNERDWLDARVRSIGSSESAAVVGYSRWCSPLGLWVRKRESRVEDDDTDAGEMADWGHRHEAAIAKKLVEVHGWDSSLLVDTGDYTIYRSVERPWISCTPDRLKMMVSTIEGEAQLKTAYFDAFKAWKERVPVAYQIQCQQSMYILGTDITWIAVLGNGYQFKHFSVERNQRFIDRLNERLDDFWHNYVEAGVEPPVDYSPASARALRDLYPKDNGKSVDLPTEVEEIGIEFDKSQAALKQAEKEFNLVKNRVMQAMGEAEVGRLPDNSGFTWRVNGKGRTLRRKEKLGEPLQ